MQYRTTFLLEGADDIGKPSPPSCVGRVAHLRERRMQGIRRVFPFPQVNGMSGKRFTCGGEGGNGGGLRDSEAVVSRWRETDGSSPKCSAGILAAGHRRSGYGPCLSIEQEACVYPGNGPILETGIPWKQAYLGNGLSRGTGLPEETCFKKEKPTSKNLFGVGLFLLCWSSVESVLFVLCRTFRTFYVRLRCMLSGHEVDGGVESGIVRVVSYYYTCIF